MGVALVVIVCVAGLSGPARGASTPSASQWLRAALRDAQTRGSVHELEANAIHGISVSISADVAAHDGRQQLIVAGTDLVRIVVLGGNVYCSASPAAALANYCSVRSTAATIVGKGWIRIPRSNSAYATIAGGVTLPSALVGVTPTGRLSETEKTSDGVRLVGITGAADVISRPFTTVTLWISTSRTPLPITAILKGPSSTGAAAFSGWGERVAITPPAPAFAYNSLPH